MKNFIENPIIKYSLEKNQLKVYHNKFKEPIDQENRNWVNYDDGYTPYDIVNKKALADDKEAFLGITINNFMDTNSIHYKGLEAEQSFKKLLNNLNIPCLYVGQGVNYTERNPTIRYCSENIKIKRPDYLVSFPELGNILIDVKCRGKWKFFDDTVFYIHYDDVDQLYELRNYMNFPVWIAFQDSQKSNDKNFYFCKIKILKELKDSFFEAYKEKKRTNHLRVPNSILTSFSEKTCLINGLSDNFEKNKFIEKMCQLETGENIDKENFLRDEKIPL